MLSTQLRIFQKLYQSIKKYAFLFWQNLLPASIRQTVTVELR